MSTESKKLNNQIIEIDLKNFFESISYDYRVDFEQTKNICLLTKTRPSERIDGEMPYGSEQVFLLKSLAKANNVKKYFEIGTGRGTSAYSVASLKCVEEVITSDILDFEKKRLTAINYKEKVLSNKDIYDLYQDKSKEKIKFIHPSKYKHIKKSHKNSIDLAFIDGNHTNIFRIYRDFAICKKLLKKDGVLLFDDYNTKEFQVKKIVDFLIKFKKIKNVALIKFHGHLFNNGDKRDYSGIAMCNLNY